MKLKLTGFSWLILIPFFLGATNDPESKVDSLMIDSLTDLAWEIALNDPYRAIELSKKALHLADSIDYVKGQRVSHGSLGLYYTDINNFIDAEKHILEELNLRVKHNEDPINIVKVYDRLCYFKRKTGDYLESIEYGLQGLEMLTVSGTENQLPSLLMNLAVVYQSNHDFDDARKFYWKALHSATSNNDDGNYLGTHHDKAFFHYEIEELDSAIFHINEGLPLAKDQENLLVEAALYDLLGAIYTKNRDFTESLDMFNRSIEINKTRRDTFRLFENYLGLSNLFYEKGAFKKALQNCILAQKQMKEFDRMDSKEKLNRQFSKVYEKLGDTKKSYRFFQVAEALEDSIFNEAKSKSIQKLKRIQAEKNENFQKLKRIDAEKETAIAQEQKSRAVNNNYKLGLSIILIFFSALISILLLNQRRISKARELVDYKKEQEKKINQLILEGTKKTRKDLSHKLHNHVSTKLTHVKRVLEPIYKQLSFDKKISDEIFKAMQIADKTHVVSRDISYELRPEKIDWVDNIKLSLAGLESITSELKVSELKEEDFSKEKGIKISAVIGNLISNVGKHSKADNVKVKIEKTNKLLTIKIEDNGVGFDSKNTKGVGLESIYSDIKELKGHINIQSINNQGTIVEVTIPLS